MSGINSVNVGSGVSSFAFEKKKAGEDKVSDMSKGYGWDLAGDVDADGNANVNQSEFDAFSNWIDQPFIKDDAGNDVPWDKYLENNFDITKLPAEYQNLYGSIQLARFAKQDVATLMGDDSLQGDVFGLIAGDDGIMSQAEMDAAIGTDGVLDKADIQKLLDGSTDSDIDAELAELGTKTTDEVADAVASLEEIDVVKDADGNIVSGMPTPVDRTRLNDIVKNTALRQQVLKDALDNGTEVKDTDGNVMDEDAIKAEQAKLDEVEANARIANAAFNAIKDDNGYISGLDRTAIDAAFPDGEIDFTKLTDDQRPEMTYAALVNSLTADDSSGTGNQAALNAELLDIGEFDKADLQDIATSIAGSDGQLTQTEFRDAVKANALRQNILEYASAHNGKDEDGNDVKDADGNVMSIDDINAELDEKKGIADDYKLLNAYFNQAADADGNVTSDSIDAVFADDTFDPADIDPDTFKYAQYTFADLLAELLGN